MYRLTVLTLLVTYWLPHTGADTPANCTYEDVEGTWTFYESEPTGDNSIECKEQTPLRHKFTVLLKYPNFVQDHYGNLGTWTMIYNQGFEATVNGRRYFAFSDYTVSEGKVTSYCNRTSVGWSHDVTVRHWACYRGVKQSAERQPAKLHQLPSSSDSDALYRNNQRLIAAINAASASWTARAYPQHQRYTRGQMLQRQGGLLLARATAPPYVQRRQQKQRDPAVLPDSFDWRRVNGRSYVSPVRDQGTCGSCYAFASMAALESQLLIHTNGSEMTVFSPQDVVSCSRYSQGCSGGFPYLVAGKYGQDFGVVEERCSPYRGQNAPCTTDPACPRTYTAGYRYIGGYYGAVSETSMRRSLVEHGPLAVSFEVYPDFIHYSGGIYHHLSHLDQRAQQLRFDPFEITNHVVLIVGYGTENGTDYWLVKNSWGTDWGIEGGFFKIRRGMDECSIESLAMEVDIIP